LELPTGQDERLDRVECRQLADASQCSEADMVATISARLPQTCSAPASWRLTGVNPEAPRRINNPSTTRQPVEGDSMRSLSRMLAAAAACLWAVAAVHAQNVVSDQETVRRAIHVCASCHGEDGRSSHPAIPSLAGQMRQYTIAQLKDFRSQTRAEAGTKAYMWGVSALLDDATIGGLADFYAEQPAAKGRRGNPAQVAAGRRIFVKGIPSRGVAACASCHGDAAEGASGFPRLAGQHATYLSAQLKTFGSKLRPHGVVMQNETRRMTPAEMRAVAQYLQSI
jgi:cytochrome c553